MTIKKANMFLKAVGRQEEIFYIGRLRDYLMARESVFFGCDRPFRRARAHCGGTMFRGSREERGGLYVPD